MPTTRNELPDNTRKALIVLVALKGALRSR